MKIQIKIPAVGESITEATIAQWLKRNGEAVKRDEVLLTLETDKATVEVVAESAGVLSVKVAEGKTVPIGSVVGEIDSEGTATATTAPSAKPSEKPSAPPPPVAKPATPPPLRNNGAGATASPDSSGPAVRRIVTETGVDTGGIQGTGKGGRLTKGDLLQNLNTGTTATPAVKAPSAPTPLPQPRTYGSADVTRQPMTKIRQTIAKRLVEAQHTAAILTTFNEIDMSNVMAIRAKYKDSFEKKYGVKLGFMGFFVKAAIEALRSFPKVNGSIDGTDMILYHYFNVGIAVGTEKGLIVPVIKHSELLSLAEIELSIKHYAEKARDGKISMEDLGGGTFTISNGGVYGSLMSTPILNPPQSAILGLHKIEERPVAIAGKVEIRPMMYVALSYDHRIIDGSESVGFLVKIKECMEDPARLLLEI